MHNVLPALAERLLASPQSMLVSDIPGFTSSRVQALLNGCVAELPSDEAYLEVGCWHGASLIAALLGNMSATAIACDNFSQFLRSNPRTHFYRHLERYRERIPPLTFLEGDCFELPRRSPPTKPIGVYFYDGEHSEESQMKAITEFHTLLADDAIVLVDDWNFPAVQRGTWRGIEAIRPKRIWFQELPARDNGDRENFWNGVGAFHLTLR